MSYTEVKVHRCDVCGLVAKNLSSSMLNGWIRFTWNAEGRSKGSCNSSYYLGGPIALDACPKCAPMVGMRFDACHRWLKELK